MNQPEILYAAVFVFSMLLIGLLLTILEFNRLQRSTSKRSQQRPASGQADEGVEAQMRKASGF